MYCVQFSSGTTSSDGPFRVERNFSRTIQALPKRLFREKRRQGYRPESTQAGDGRYDNGEGKDLSGLPGESIPGAPDPLSRWAAIRLCARVPPQLHLFSADSRSACRQSLREWERKTVRILSRTRIKGSPHLLCRLARIEFERVRRLPFFRSEGADGPVSLSA